MRQHSTAYVPYSYYKCSLPYSFMSVPMHWHSEFELNYISCGMGEFTCGGETFTAEKGDLILLPPNMLHAAYPDPKSGLVYHALVFSPIILGANVHDRCTIEYIRPLINGARKITPLIPKSAKNYPLLECSAKQIFSCALKELMRFFWLLETDDGILRQKEEETDYGEQIRPALEYMMNHFHKKISIAQLAGLSHLSQSYFMSCFKKAVGLSSIEYVSQLRVNAACDALFSTDKKISEIAFACGYENLSNFNRQFKRSTGFSPSEYRSHQKASLPG